MSSRTLKMKGTKVLTLACAPRVNYEEIQFLTACIYTCVCNYILLGTT